MVAPQGFLADTIDYYCTLYYRDWGGQFPVYCKEGMAYKLPYRAADRTLTGEEVEKNHERLVKKVCGATGAEVRG